MKLRQILTTAASQLAEDEHLRASANRDAELLLLHTLQISRAILLAYPDREVPSEQQTLYHSLILRRLRHEPVQYILGQQEFYGLNFCVTPAVLIPRPETEHLVEAVLKMTPSNAHAKLVDVGTGSGAIAVALAFNLPHAEITALDISSDALGVAAGNAREHKVEDRIRFLQSDLLSTVSEEGGFDAIVSNPPYIPETDRPTLHPQVREHEPATALFAGETGLDIYRRLIPQAYKALKQNGLLALEIGYGQEAALTELLDGWKNVSFVNDLQGIPRVALARRA